MFDIPIDYESINKTGAIMGSGGMVVMDDTSCMVDIAKFFLNFTADESCGKCTPCRVGTKVMLEILKRISEGNGRMEDLDTLAYLSESIIDAALCGLGKTAPNPVLTTLKYFREEYEAHVLEKRCPAHSCAALLKFRVIPELCIKCGICSRSCESNAIVWEKGQMAFIDQKKCIRCRVCFGVCPSRAIE
jgi:ferredoxin